MPELLFYGGVLLMAGSAAGALVSGILLRRAKKRLSKRLDMEYGEPHH